MATATDHLFDKPAPNGKLNGSATRAAHARNPSGDSAIEAFPPFDPDAVHQEQEQDSDDAAETTMSTATNGNGSGNGIVQRPIVTSTDPEAAAQLRVQPAERVTSPVTSPPYWVHSHNRTASSVSVESVLPAGAITLQDNEATDEDEGRSGGDSARNSHGRDRNRACWAKSVEVTDHVVVNGSATNIGAFVVWNIRVETLSGSYMNIRKRYSEFDDFRQQLIHSFPNFEAAVPSLPPKSVISKFRPRFLEKRRAGLQYFLNCILLNPEFSGSPVLKEFLFN